MKPHEETWEAGGSYTVERASDRACLFDVLHEDGETRGRTKLVAAAPDLARALLAVEFGYPHGPNEAFGICPACGSNLMAMGPPAHRGGCALDAALRKAGVR